MDFVLIIMRRHDTCVQMNCAVEGDKSPKIIARHVHVYISCSRLQKYFWPITDIYKCIRRPFYLSYMHFHAATASSQSTNN